MTGKGRFEALQALWLCGRGQRVSAEACVGLLGLLRWMLTLLHRPSRDTLSLASTGGASRARGPPRKKAASRHQADTSAEEAATAPGPSAAARRRSGGLEGQAQEQQAAAGTTGRADEADAGASEEDAKPKRGRGTWCAVCP